MGDDRVQAEEKENGLIYFNSQAVGIYYPEIHFSSIFSIKIHGKNPWRQNSFWNADLHIVQKFTISKENFETFII